MTKLILTDVDDTILRFADPFQGWIESKGIETQGRLRDNYNIETWLGADHETVRNLLIEFGTTEVARDQPPETCALEVLPFLNGKGYEFIAISACGTNPEFREKRRRTLHATFGFSFKDVHVVSPKSSKEGYLWAYRQAIWVEDNMKHAVAGALAGHRTFLIDRPYNQNMEHPLVTRVSGWHDIRTHLGE